MADIYYFNSPLQPVENVRIRPPLKTNSKLARLRRKDTGSMYSQYACVARIDEHIFCPTGSSTLFAPGSITYAASSTEALRPHVQPEIPLNAMNDDDNEEYDYDSEWTSGVPVGPDHDHRTTSGRLEDAHGLSDPLPEAGLSTSNITLNGRPSQSRPETRDIWEEEAGRRMRLALDGASPDEDHEFDPAPPSIPQTSGYPPHVRLDTELSTRHEVARAPYAGSRRSSQQSLSTALAAGTSTLDVPPPRRNSHHIDRDDDFLAVDDPQRKYDFVEFMDTCRLRSLRDRRFSNFGSGQLAWKKTWQAAELVSRKDFLSGDGDMQGIAWPHTDRGRLRAQVTYARSLLHPSGTNPDFVETQTAMPPSPPGRSERHYRFRSFVAQHKANFSHYQLRSVLAASGRNDVFYANGSKVMRASLACPTQSETAVDLSRPMYCAPGFRVTCLSASPRTSFSSYRSDAVLLAGGFEGEFAMLDLSTNKEPHVEGMVTHAYNGLVTHIHNYADRVSGSLRAAFCSNDSKVRLMDVRRLQFIDTFNYHTAINCSATSADGRLRALVGDSCETIITDAEKGNTLVTLREHTDHGFACSWSQDGRNVATAAQDGKIVVWDTRNWSEPLRLLDTAMSCARSLNFTDNGALVVAENDDVVRVYDGGSFGAWQEIRFFGSIAGVTLIDGGAEMVVANVDKNVGGLLSFERNNEAARYAKDPQHAEPAGSGRGSRWRQRKAVREWDVSGGVTT